VAWAPLATLSAGLTVLLLALAGGYGYHRDELYFLRAGREAAFGYVDQPPLTPLLAHAMDSLFPGSLVALRTPSAISAGLVVLLTGVIARELGTRRAGQVLAAASTAVAAVFIAVGHLLSTTTLDVLAWTALSWLLVRALRDGGPVWLATGAVAGLALENKTSPAFLLAGVLVGVLTAGPRSVFRSPWPWAGGAVALLLWAPNLAWQATHGWPLLQLAGAIAGGSSGTSEPWYLFLPMQLVLVSPLLVPVWGAGWWRLARDPELRTWRAFAVAYALLTVLFIGTGGKPYYIAGLYPVLLAAGAEPVLRWVERRAPRLRRWLVAAALVSSLAIASFLFLPVVPVTALHATPVLAVNYDAGETVGWPRFAEQVEAVRAGIPAGERVAVLTANYGQAGAIDRFAPELGPAYSGHNSYGTWGPPPDDASTLIVVGYDRADLERWFGRIEQAGRIDNGVDLDNDEQGTPLWIVRDPLEPWSRLWPQLRHIG